VSGPVLALRAAGRSTRSGAVKEAADFIAGQANADGGFNFAGKGGPSGIDDTSAAVQALVAAGRKQGRAVKRATGFVVRNQASDGGFALIPGGASNAQSTAWAVQGLLAAGRDPARVKRSGSRDPMSYLRSLTGEDGAVRYSRTSEQTPVWVTAQAVAALARKTLPLKPVKRARSTAVASAASPPEPTPTTAPAATPQALPPVGTPVAATPAVIEAAAGIPAAGALFAALLR